MPTPDYRIHVVVTDGVPPDSPRRSVSLPCALARRISCGMHRSLGAVATRWPHEQQAVRPSCHLGSLPRASISLLRAPSVAWRCLGRRYAGWRPLCHSPPACACCYCGKSRSSALALPYDSRCPLLPLLPLFVSPAAINLEANRKSRSVPDAWQPRHGCRALVHAGPVSEAAVGAEPAGMRTFMSGAAAAKVPDSSGPGVSPAGRGVTAPGFDVVAGNSVPVACQRRKWWQLSWGGAENRAWGGRHRRELCRSWCRWQHRLRRAGACMRKVVRNKEVAVRSSNGCVTAATGSRAAAHA